VAPKMCPEELACRGSGRCAIPTLAGEAALMTLT
jgi:hypothetical protein